MNTPQQNATVDTYVTIEDVQKVKNGPGSDSSYTDSLEAVPVDGKPREITRRKKKSRLPVLRSNAQNMPKKMDVQKGSPNLDSNDGQAAEDNQNPESRNHTSESKNHNCHHSADSKNHNSQTLDPKNHNSHHSSEKKCQRSQSTEEHGSKNSSGSSLSRRETIDLGETKARNSGKPLRECKMDVFMNSNECFLIPNPPGSLPLKDTITSRMRIEKAHNEHVDPIDPSDYLTPFQRKEQAIRDLRREMKQMGKILEDRDSEIEQLREGLGKEARELLSSKDLRIAEVQTSLSEVEQKYEELKMSYEESVKTISSLEATVTDLKETIAETNQRHESLYLEMYVKGQNAARYEREEELFLQIEEMAGKASNKFFKKTNFQHEVNVKELLTKLNRTQEELAKWQSLRRQESYQESEKPETEADATLRFLRDSFFHYVTDGKGQDDHMRAMIQIFNFTDVQKKKIAKSLLEKKSKS